MIVKIHNGPDSKEEFCLLEFQGEMVGELAGNELGQIVIKEDGKAEMDIGQHFLEGELTSLKMPFLVTEKKVTEGGSTLSIVGLVRKKVIFNTRPKPLGLKRLNR